MNEQRRTQEQVKQGRKVGTRNRSKNKEKRKAQGKKWPKGAEVRMEVYVKTIL
jgi:hypothetical protein